MLKSTLAAMAAVFAISAFSPAMAAKGDPHVLLTTSAGNIELELNSQKAPISVDNFLEYVNSGFYNNTTFCLLYTSLFPRRWINYVKCASASMRPATTSASKWMAA